MARRRNRRRRRRGSFILSLLSFLIVIGAIIAAVTVFLRVADIEVSGTTRYKATDIIETSGIKNGDHLLFVNKFEVARNILNEYPYIKQIKIRRRLPDTFTFEITERTPTAYIENQGTMWLLDDSNFILEMLDEGEIPNLPKVVGGEVVTPYTGSELVMKNEARAQVLKEVLTAIRKTGMAEKIVRIEIAEMHDIKLVYGDRFLVTLGNAESLSKKIEMLKAVVEKLGDFERGTINVSAIKEARFRPDNKIVLAESVENALEDKAEVSEEETDETALNENAGEEAKNTEETTEEDADETVVEEGEDKNQEE